MGALSKGVSLQFGLISTTVSVYNALEPKISNVSACTGIEGKVAHDLTKIQQKRHCPACNDEVPFEQVKKARDVGGALAPITKEEIESAKIDSTKYKKAASLTPHPAEQVAEGTVPGKALYYLTPETGQEQTYAVLRHLVKQHPELTFLTLWTPRSSASVYALSVRGDVLVLQERVRGEATKATPAITADAPDALLGMAEQVLNLPGIIGDFDPAKYADTYEANIQAILATKTPVASGVAPVAAVPTPVDAAPDLMAQLSAMMTAAKAA